MIRKIRIYNYALIRDLEIEPSNGFNIITGETGAGKSIILGALGLLQGKRFDSKSVGNANEKSFVEAEVILHDGSSHTLRREILPSGRSKSLIDGRSVALSELADTAHPLIEIHSQHQNLLLVDPVFQLETIDKLAHNEEILRKYSSLFSEYRSALSMFSKTRDEIEQAKKDADYLEFQLKEFEGIDLIEGEDEELEKEKEKLSHSQDIFIALNNAANLMSQSEDSASDKIQNALYDLRDAANLSERYNDFAERLEDLNRRLRSLADEIGDEVAEMFDEPTSLEEVENKLAKINSLKKKHRADNVGELIKIRSNISERLGLLNDSETILHNLELNARKLKRLTLEIAKELSERRKNAAEMLEKELTDRARPLGMENLSFKINFSTGKLKADGYDTIEFLFAFNKNQELASAANRASGGELSRVMLALKSIVVEHQLTPTIIFDEIDTGVSGDVANRMGQLMALIGKHIQVISITHLPQVAALGDTHFKVFKMDDDSSTATYIKELDHEGRRAEMALMLCGNPNDSAALNTADSLLNKK